MTFEKMRIDMPLPMPRWVMFSPSHMTKAVPAVRTRIMNRMWGALKYLLSMIGVGVAKMSPEWKRNTSPALCMMASETVRYRVAWVSLR